MDVGTEIGAEGVGTRHLADSDRRLGLERQDDEVTLLHALPKRPQLAHPVGDATFTGVRVACAHDLLDGTSRAGGRKIRHLLPTDHAEALFQSQGLALTVAPGARQPHGHHRPLIGHPCA